LNFHMPIHWSMAEVPSSPAIFHFLMRKAPCSGRIVERAAVVRDDSEIAIDTVRYVP
jgi:hypothetical protein